MAAKRTRERLIEVPIRLRGAELDRICEMAAAERRMPADQAAYIIAQYLSSVTTIQQPASAGA